MEEMIWRTIEQLDQVVDGDVISLIQLILFLYLFRDRLSGHSIARDIGEIADSVDKIEKKIDRLPTDDGVMATRVSRIEDKIDKLPTKDSAMADSVASIEKKIDKLPTKGSAMADSIARIEDKIDKLPTKR